MYLPPAFSETRAELIETVMAAHPLATLVTMGPRGLQASHIPLLYEKGVAGAVLRGHIARANPQWQDYGAETEALAIFHGPQHYISPAWYPSTREHGKAVPTWNYVVVHARGALRFHNEPSWLLENVRALTDKQETAAGTAWRVEDAPQGFIEQMLGAIIGIEMAVTLLEGKWKVSQNRTRRDREGVVAALRDRESFDALQMADLVKAAMEPDGAA